MARWLASQGVSHVAMEATGIYTMPVFHALLESGAFEQVQSPSHPPREPRF